MFCAVRRKNRQALETRVDVADDPKVLLMEDGPYFQQVRLFRKIARPAVPTRAGRRIFPAGKKPTKFAPHYPPSPLIGRGITRLLAFPTCMVAVHRSHCWFSLPKAAVPRARWWYLRFMLRLPWNSALQSRLSLVFTRTIVPLLVVPNHWKSRSESAKSLAN